ncbi:MAG: membrane protein insertion efficiency factor YidD [Lentisphaerae bacterium]|nr:membrane protein insertion efficiency factor YidD [Lentisphaerota bacterium]
MKRHLLLSLALLALPLPGGATGLDLARELAAEGDWRACLTECRRVEVENPELATPARELRQRVSATLTATPRSSSWWRRIGALPVKAMVGFYRFAVAPALGTRCSLTPSCSAYSLQAARERGWLGLPMTGDRLIREPDVVNARQSPFRKNGRTLYPDPISAHIGGHSNHMHTQSRTQP